MLQGPAITISQPEKAGKSEIEGTLKDGFVKSCADEAVIKPAIFITPSSPHCLEVPGQRASYVDCERKRAAPPPCLTQQHSSGHRSRAGSIVTQATRGSSEELEAEVDERCGFRNTSSPWGLQSFYDGVIGVLFRHWVHSTCCDGSQSKVGAIDARTFQETRDPLLLRRSSRSRTLAACAQLTSPHYTSEATTSRDGTTPLAGVPPAGISPRNYGEDTATSQSSAGSRRRRQSHIEGGAERILQRLAKAIDPDDLICECDDVPIETHTERAILALALRTPRNSKSGRGIWLLNHQHQHHKQLAQGEGSFPFSGSNSDRSLCENVNKARISQEIAGHLSRNANDPNSTPLTAPSTKDAADTSPFDESVPTNDSQDEIRTPKNAKTTEHTVDIPSRTEVLTTRDSQKSEQFNHLPLFEGDIHKAPPTVDPKTRIDCGKVTNAELEFLISPEVPLIDSAKVLSRPMIGRWETVLTRSDSLEKLFRAFGIPYFKRVVVDKLAIPLDIEFEDNERILHVVLTLPIGHRHMRMTLDGTASVDEDPDCGAWEGVVQIGDHSVPWFRDGKPFKALQQVRHNRRIGKVLETRAVLPDATYGRVMIMQFYLYGKDPSGDIVCNRLLKPLP